MALEEKPTLDFYLSSFLPDEYILRVADFRNEFPLPPIVGLSGLRVFSTFPSLPSGTGFLPILARLKVRHL